MDFKIESYQEFADTVLYKREKAERLKNELSKLESDKKALIAEYDEKTNKREDTGDLNKRIMKLNDTIKEKQNDLELLTVTSKPHILADKVYYDYKGEKARYDAKQREIHQAKKDALAEYEAKVKELDSEKVAVTNTFEKVFNEQVAPAVDDMKLADESISVYDPRERKHIKKPQGEQIKQQLQRREREGYFH